jgi:hypothetical protein
MIDSFPYDAWFDAEGNLREDITTFWTFGPAGGSEGGDLIGTFVLTGLGLLLMVGAFIGWVLLEDRKLTLQARRLRAGMAGRAGGEPLAGPSIDPGP